MTVRTGGKCEWPGAVIAHWTPTFEGVCLLYACYCDELALSPLPRLTFLFDVDDIQSSYVARQARYIHSQV